LMVTFEADSKLKLIGIAAFSRCASLRTICIPSSVETIQHDCFCGCQSLATVTFESGSRLSCIQGVLFCNCSSLRSISIPISLQTILSGYRGLLKVIVREDESVANGQLGEVQRDGANPPIRE
jgi:hypothetical protein